jgi:branched-chain amino acid transport system substrate-binding protein
LRRREKPGEDWYQGDASIIDPMVKELSAKYAKEKNIKPRSC